jgi:hypothetical protein
MKYKFLIIKAREEGEGRRNKRKEGWVGDEARDHILFRKKKKILNFGPTPKKRSWYNWEKVTFPVQVSAV